MKIRKILAAIAASAVATSAMAVMASAADNNGYIMYQTTQYSFRNDWDEANYGKATDYFDGYVVWGNPDTDPDTYPGYEDYFDYDVAGYILPANYTDVKITGDGTYKVEAAGIDWAIRGDTDFNLIGVSTDVPIDAGAVCTSATVYVDGEAVKTYENPICDETKAYFNIGLVNIWNTEIGSWGLAYPTDSLAIEFTIEGLGGAAAEDATEAPAAGDVAGATDSSKGSPDTGIEDVAVIGGLAVLAGAAIAFTRKRK